MAYRMYGALIVPLSFAVMISGVSGCLAQLAMADTHAGKFSHTVPGPPAGHHRRGHPGVFWPATGPYAYAPPSHGEPRPTDINQSIKGDIRYTYTQDVPWDWAHRLPPVVAPSDRPYVQSCPSESVTVPGRNGKERTVNIMRCY